MSTVKRCSFTCHEIAGYGIHVEFADSWQQVDPLELNIHEHTVLPIELTNVTGTHLLNLIDDCLYEILSSESLTLMDLCSLAETSTRLFEMSNRIFKKRYKDFHLSSSVGTFDQIRRVFINFGSSMSKLWFDFQSRKTIRVMNMVRFYCLETLQSLTIDYFALTGVEKNFFKEFGSLVELIVSGYRSYYPSPLTIFESTFPKLKIFECNCPTLSLIIISKWKSTWNDFISRHNNLETLRLKQFGGCINTLLVTISNHCNQMENLQITSIGYTPQLREDALVKLTTLPKLKKLQIECDEQNVIKFAKELQSLESLEFLELHNISGDSELLPVLSQLKKLHVLQLSFCRFFPDDVTHLAELFKGLVNLKTLSIQALYVYTMNEDTYLKIVDVVRVLAHKPQVTIRCSMDVNFQYKMSTLRSHEENNQIVKIC